MRSKKPEGMEAGTDSKPLQNARKILGEYYNKSYQTMLGLPDDKKLKKMDTAERTKLELEARQRVALAELQAQETLTELARSNPEDDSAELMERFWKTPAGKSVLKPKVQEVVSALNGRPAPTVLEQRRAETQNLSLFYQNKYPSIDWKMDERAIIEAAAKDAGGSLAPMEMARLQRMIRKMKGGE